MSWSTLMLKYFSNAPAHKLSTDDSLIKSIPIQEIAYNALVEAKNIEACVLYVMGINISVTRFNKDYYNIKATAVIEPADSHLPPFLKTIATEVVFYENGLKEEFKNVIGLAIINAKKYGFNLSRLSEKDITTEFIEDDSF